MPGRSVYGGFRLQIGKRIMADPTPNRAAKASHRLNEAQPRWAGPSEILQAERKRSQPGMEQSSRQYLNN
jgi:hypothetical protein